MGQSEAAGGGFTGGKLPMLAGKPNTQWHLGVYCVPGPGFAEETAGLRPEGARGPTPRLSAAEPLRAPRRRRSALPPRRADPPQRGRIPAALARPPRANAAQRSARSSRVPAGPPSRLTFDFRLTLPTSGKESPTPSSVSHLCALPAASPRARPRAGFPCARRPPPLSGPRRARSRAACRAGPRGARSRGRRGAAGGAARRRIPPPALPRAAPAPLPAGRARRPAPQTVLVATATACPGPAPGDCSVSAGLPAPSSLSCCPWLPRPRQPAPARLASARPRRAPASLQRARLPAVPARRASRCMGRSPCR